MALTLHHLVCDGVADGPLGIALDIVAVAARLTASGRVRLAGVQPPRQRLVSQDGRPVTSSAGRRVEVDGPLQAGRIAPGDVVALPGIGLFSPAALAAGLLRADLKAVMALLSRLAERRVRLAASCSSTFLLGEAGLLDGQEATTNWWLAPEFARRYPRVRLRVDRMVVTSKRRFTAGAAFAHADLMLALVAETLSPSLAHLVAKYLVLDARAAQSRYMVKEHLRCADPLVRRLERYVLAHLDRQLPLCELARAAATSPRTLSRRLHAALGTTPHRFAQQLRIRRAVELLETTCDSVDEVAARVGYADAAAFRRLFRRETGEAPSRLRR